MQRVSTATATQDKPPYTPGEPGYFTGGDPLSARPATVPGPDWFNRVQEEICNVITSAGLALDGEDDTQLARAITAMIAEAIVDVGSATTEAAGVVELATPEEAIAGTDDSLAMTPATTEAAVAGKVRAYTRQQYAEPVVLVGQSGTVALDAELHQDIDITAGADIALDEPLHPARGMYMTMTLRAASAHAITWDAVFAESAQALLPTEFLPGKAILLQFRCMDGAAWLLIGRVDEA